jgi:hypothetical protein
MGSKTASKKENKVKSAIQFQAYAPILNTFVEQFGHEPLIAGFLFFNVTFVGFLISTFFLHLTQYACGIFSPHTNLFMNVNINVSNFVRLIHSRIKHRNP